MLKKGIALLLALILPLLALAEGITADTDFVETWVYETWLDGGITWAVPADTETPDAQPEDAELGIVWRLENESFTAQLRRYAPAEMTFELYVAILSEEEGTELQVANNGFATVASYRNAEANTDSELFGALITGLDGSLYKISVFAGAAGDITEEAPVWEICEMLRQTLTTMDLETWLAEREVS